MTTIITSLWFAERAVEAAEFYVALVPDSRIDSVTILPGTPSGDVELVELTLAGRPFVAMAAGPFDPFNHAISLTLACDDQPAIDRLSAGGTIEQCGWLRDRYGVSWQIVPTRLGAMLKDPDRVRAGRVMAAQLTMRKFDLAALEAAYAG